MEDVTWRNWSDLLPDLVLKISKNILNLQDFIRFRAVCKSWRWAVPCSKAHQLPWILENPIGQLGKIRFYSLSSAQLYEFLVPESHLKKFFGPGRGHLLYFSARTRSLSMLDPIANREVGLPLPPPTSVGFPTQKLVRDGNNVILLEGMDALYMHKPIWESVKNFPFGHVYSHKGQILLQNLAGHTVGVDVNDVDELNFPLVFDSPRPGLELHSDYLVESAGALLRVLQYSDQSSSGSYHFSLYRLDSGNGDSNCKACWVEISTIDDQILFLSKHRGLSMSASGFQEYEGDCIYFFDKIVSKFQVCQYHIKTGTTEVVPCPLERGSTWFVPVFSTQ